MIDVNKITSTLAKLPDAQLQQYAQMHKADPYIMALAMSESNRRKELRAAGQGAQGMQEQPKVVDQMVAEMAPQQLPEEMGIGQLPAGNMNFAGGGIVAFADGGDVERYAGGGDLLRTTTGGKSWFLDVPSTMRDPSVPYYREIPSPFGGLAGKQFTTKEEALAAYNQLAPSATPVAAPKVTPTYSPDDYSGMDRRIMSGSQQPSIPSITPPAVKAAPTADTGRKAPDAGLGAAAAANAAKTATGPSDIDALQQKYFGALDQDTGTLRNARAGLVAGIKDLTEKNLAATKAAIEQRGDVYKGREERLAKQEKGLEGMGDKYMGLALLQAGAAMMSTPGGLGVALGKGIQVGSERYVAGLDKIETAKAKFAEARDRLDDLRINRDDMNAREIRAAEKEAREAGLKGQELLYNGLVTDLGAKRKDVTAIFGAAADDLKTTRQIDAERQNTITREGGANARAAAQIAASLNTPDRALWDQLMKKNDNDATKALEAFKLAKGDKFDVRSSYADYLKAFAGKEGLTPPMSMGAYAGQFGATLPR